MKPLRLSVSLAIAMIATVLYPLAAFAQAVAAPTDVKGALISGAIQYVLPVAFSAVATLLTYALAQLGAYLKAKAGGSNVAAVLLRVETVIASVVHRLEATLRTELGMATADGKLDQAEIIHLQSVALDEVKAALREEGLAQVQGVMGLAKDAVDAFLRGLIERHVAALPATNPLPQAFMVQPSSPNAIAAAVTAVPR